MFMFFLLRRVRSCGWQARAGLQLPDRLARHLHPDLGAQWPVQLNSPVRWTRLWEKQTSQSTISSISPFLFTTLAKTGKVLLIIPGLAGEFKKLLYKAAREHDYEKTEGIMRDVFKKVVSEDLKPALKKISVPTLILWGENDKMTPISGASLVGQSIKQSKIRLFKEEGHRLPYNKPRVLAREIDKWFQSSI